MRRASIAAVLLMVSCDRGSDESAALVSVPGTTDAERLAECGGWIGKAYYPFTGIVPKKDSGWTDDKMSGGASLLLRRPDGSLDIIFRDATGGIYSAAEEGATIKVVRPLPSAVTLTVDYEPTGDLEIYTYVRDEDGRAQMILSQSKGSEMMQKAGLYTADCSSLDLDKLSAPAPAEVTPTEAPPASPELADTSPVVPARFRGEYNEKLEDCGTGNNPSSLMIGANTIAFYESSGPITSATVNGRGMRLATKLTGEGQTWEASHRFLLSADGQTLTDIGGEEPYARWRCPARQAGAQ